MAAGPAVVVVVVPPSARRRRRGDAARDERRRSLSSIVAASIIFPPRPPRLRRREDGRRLSDGGENGETGGGGRRRTTSAEKTAAMETNPGCRRRGHRAAVDCIAEYGNVPHTTTPAHYGFSGGKKKHQIICTMYRFQINCTFFPKSEIFYTENVKNLGMRYKISL